MYIAVYLTSEIARVLRRREQDLARLEESLRQANQALMEHDRIRSEYVLRVSHDLQSPLAATTSMLSLVLSTMSAEMPEKGRDFLRRSLRRVEGLLRLARGLYDISRIRASRTLAIEPFGLDTVVRAAIEDMLLKPSEKEIDLSLDLAENLPFVSGDKDHVEMAFIHLLTNAAQYSLPGVRIAVRAREVGGGIEVVVEDSGVGIQPEEMAHIFEEFYRGSMARELEPNGWGLGLTLVKHIIDRHGGAIRVVSEPGKGTTFTITLPAHRAGD